MQFLGKKTVDGRIALLALAGLLSACAEDPFVTTDYRFHQRGLVTVCYNPETATRAKAQVLAEEICRQYDRVAKFSMEQPYQCSWTAPTQAMFNCVPRQGEAPPPVTEQSAPMRHDPKLPPP